MNKHLLLVAVALLFTRPSAMAQSPFEDAGVAAGPAFGVYFDHNFNWHTADFTSLPGVPSCCHGYTAGKGNGQSFGVFYRMPLLYVLAFELRAGYYRYDAVLRQDEATAFSSNGGILPGTIRYTLDASLASIGIEPLLRWRAWKDLSLLLGPRIGAVVTKTHVQDETILEPAWGTFMTTKSNTERLSSGTLPQALSVQAALIAGISYDLPLTSNGSVILTPEILCSYGLTPIVRDLTWIASSLRLGLSLSYALY
jgi:hypothetical protein